MNKIIKKLSTHKKNILTIFAGQTFAAIGTLVGVRLLTEFISPALFGEYKLLLAGISLASGILIRPFIQFSMREYHDADKQGLLLQFINSTRTILRYYIFLILLSAGFLIGLFLYFSMSLSYLAIFMILATFALRNSIEFERALSVTGNKQTQASTVSVARNWLPPIAIITTVILTNNESVYIIFSSTAAVLALIYFAQLSINFTATPLKYTNSSTANYMTIVRSAIRFGAPLASVGLLSWLVHESDRFFLAYYHSDRVVGLYSAAYGLVSAPFTLVAGSMAQFLYPIMFRVSASDDPKKRLNIMKAMLITTSVISLLGVLLVGLLGEQIAWLALGENYREGATPLLLWIALGYSFIAVSFSFDLAAYGSKRTLDMFISYGISAVINIGLNIMLIPAHGAMGAVTATVIALFFYLIIIATLFFLKEKQIISPKTTAKID